MKFLFDLFPVILFFITYKLSSNGENTNACFASTSSTQSFFHEPILMATSVAIVATFLQVFWLVYRRREVSPMLWASLALIVTFGGATLYFRDPTFIQWKPTLLYWLFGLTLVISLLGWEKNLIEEMMKEQITLPPTIWSKLNYAWAIFWIIMGIANLVAVKHLSCDGWLNFKLFGSTSMMFAFVVAQSFYLSKFMEKE